MAIGKCKKCGQRVPEIALRSGLCVLCELSKKKEDEKQTELY